MIFFKKIKKCIKNKRYNVCYLTILDKFSQLHNKFNKNTLLKIAIFIAISFVLSLLWKEELCTGNYEALISTLKNGFFVAPLISLMVTHQEKIITIFLEIFSLDINESDNLDSVSKKIKVLIKQKKRESSSFREEEEQVWNICKNTMEASIEVRTDFNRLNNQSLLFAGSLLFIGYMFLLFNYPVVAMFFLTASFLAIFNRLFLGIRSILKFYAIYSVLKDLNIEVENEEHKSFKNIISQSTSDVKEENENENNFI